MKKQLAIFLAAACTLCAATAQKTTLLTPEKANDYGLVYMLPRTALQITITATRTQKTPGTFYRYAKRYIGTENVISEPSVSWTIDKVEVSPFGVADMENKYVMQLKPGQPASICVDENGVLLAINTEVELPAREGAFAEPLRPGKINGNEYLQYVTGDFLASQSSAKQAQMLAESIMEVRESKLALTRGTAETMPADGRQLELMLNSLADQEATMMRAFTGFTESQTISRTYTFNPSTTGRKVLCRLSNVNGFTDSDDLSGEPFFIEISDIRTAVVPEEDGKERKMPKDGVVYALPGAATVTISYRGADIWRGSFDMTQFGTVFALPPTIFTDKKAPQFAVFDPATGALLETGNVE